MYVCVFMYFFRYGIVQLIFLTAIMDSQLFQNEIIALPQMTDSNICYY